MAALSNHVLESFARSVAAGMPKAAAARQAGIGNSQANQWGFRAAKLPEVETRILELQSVQKGASSPGDESIPYKAMLEESVGVYKINRIYDLALKDRQYAVALTAATRLMEAGGHLGPKATAAAGPRNQVINNTLVLTGGLRQALNHLTGDERARLLSQCPELTSAIDVTATPADVDESLDLL